MRLGIELVTHQTARDPSAVGIRAVRLPFSGSTARAIVSSRPLRLDPWTKLLDSELPYWHTPMPDIQSTPMPEVARLSLHLVLLVVLFERRLERPRV